MTVLNMVKDAGGYVTFGLPFSTDKYSITLAADAAVSLTIPSNQPAFLAVFSFEPGTSVWVAKNQTAAAPAGGTFATTTSELNPNARAVGAGDTLSFFTLDTTADIGVTLYVIPFKPV